MCTPYTDLALARDEAVGLLAKAYEEIDELVRENEELRAKVAAAATVRAAAQQQ